MPRFTKYPTGILLALLVAAVAQACPVTPGYVGNGLLPTPAGLSAQCKLIKTLRTPELAWVEAYFVQESALANIAKKLKASLAARGYSLVSEDRQPEAYTAGYSRANDSLIVQFGVHEGKNILALAQPIKK